jgi:hypothetical protein
MKDKDGVPLGQRFDCNECTAEDKIARGCDGGVKWQFGDIEIEGCPEKLLDLETLQHITIWKRFKLYNSFPFLGGWAETPAAILTVIELLEAEFSKMTAERMEHG